MSAGEKKELYKKIFTAAQYDFKAIEEYLEEMACKGYMFTEIKGIFWCFEKCEPTKLRFQVDNFDKATIFDGASEGETTEYVEYCEQCGWHYITGNGKMQFFYTKDENAVPIQTDAELELKNVVKSTLKSNIFSWFMLPAVFLLNIVIGMLQIFDNTYGIFTNNISGDNLMCIGVGFYVVYILVTIASVLRFVIFVGRSRRSIAKGGGLKFYSGRATAIYGMFNRIVVLCLLGILTFFVIRYGEKGNKWVFIVTVAVMLLAAAATMLISCRMKPTRNNKIILTVVMSVAAVYICFAIAMIAVFNVDSGHKVEYGGTEYHFANDNLPVNLKELGVGREDYIYEERSADESSSVFAEFESYNDVYWCDDGSGELTDCECFGVDVFTGKYDWVIDRYEKCVDKLSGNSMNAVNTPKGFEDYEAYSFSNENYNYYYLKDGDRRILIKYNFEMKQEMADKLVNAYTKQNE
ncbi:MAG: DUF2812 domain-containing protein [Butyrivibrio sp.]